MIRRNVGMNDAYGVSRAFLHNHWGIKKLEVESRSQL